MAKRGRKPSAKRKGYFYEDEEQAVINYLNTDDAETKNAIFIGKLQEPFTKMIESIIRRYRLYYPDEEFEETFNKTFSFLITKLDKFKPEKNPKAYSYYQTIIKNFLIGRLSKRAKQIERAPSYDSSAEMFDNNLKYSTIEDDEDDFAKEVLDNLVERIKSMVGTPDVYSLTETEINVGNALLKLFENWDFILTTNGSPKLNKSTIFFFLRETTGLDTLSIRKGMKKYKDEFLKIKDLLM